MAALARSAHGVVTRRELLAAGISDTQIKKRVRKGALIRQYPGVYRVGHAAPSTDASFMAAVKACGEGAALGGRAAGWFLGLLKGKAPRPEVITPTERRVAGIFTHRVRRETTKIRGIPVTTVAETLVDLAAVLTPAQLARACHEAGVLYGTTPRHVQEVLARRSNARGARALMAVMRGDVKVTLSRLESEFLRLLREAGLPLPVTNRVAGGRRVDCRWPDRKLTVELDSFRYHNSRHSWEQSFRREREARARYDEFRRYTWADVENPQLMLGELRRLL